MNSRKYKTLQGIKNYQKTKRYDIWRQSNFLIASARLRSGISNYMSLDNKGKGRRLSNHRFHKLMKSLRKKIQVEHYPQFNLIAALKPPSLHDEIISFSRRPLEFERDTSMDMIDAIRYSFTANAVPTSPIIFDDYLFGERK